MAVDSPASAVPPLLRMAGVGKSFPGVRALDGIDLDLHSGEVLALLGENGAGKSTLIKILGGAHRPDSGSIEIGGSPVHISHPRHAQAAGVAIIYQEFNLVPAMTARENIFLGRERGRMGLLSAAEERRQAETLFERIGVEVDPEALCRNLTVAQQQVVEIAKALAQEARIIVMDEPTASLTPREVDKLLAIVRDLRAQGIGIIYISHRLDEVFALADRAMVLRDGGHVDTRPVSDLTRDAVIQLMVGRSLDQEYPKRKADIGEVRLHASGLRRGAAVRGVDLEMRRGEVLGLTGLVGAGRTETARLLFGADKREAGVIELDGQSLRIKTPRDAIAAGICMLTEDRKAEGLILSQSVQDNFGLPNLRAFSQWGFIHRGREAGALVEHVESLRIKLADARQNANTLSGGNQQKVVLAKWLERNAEVLIFDEPTRGIDVGAKYEIYQLMNRLAARGKAILMISSELPEVLGMSDRILVMHEGRVTGEITEVENATQEDIMQMAVGGLEAAA
jgi:ABC-type sugar transport system ATPase subunit